MTVQGLGGAAREEGGVVKVREDVAGGGTGQAGVHLEDVLGQALLHGLLSTLPSLVLLVLHLPLTTQVKTVTLQCMVCVYFTCH